MIDDQDVIKNRFDELIINLEQDNAFNSYKELAGMLGYTPQKLNEVLKGRTKLNLNFLQIFCTKFNFSLDYIVFGKPKQQKKVIKKYDNLNDNQIEKDQNSNKRLSNELLKEKDTTDNIIVLSATAAASDFSESLINPVYTDGLERISLPEFKHRKGIFYAVSIKGYSMFPTVKENDTIVGGIKQLQDFVGGIPYVFFHEDEGLLVKRFYWHDKENGILRLVSDNENYTDFITSVTKIQSQIIKVETIISTNIYNWYNDVRNDIKDLKDAVKRLDSK